MYREKAEGEGETACKKKGNYGKGGKLIEGEDKERGKSVKKRKQGG